MIVRICLFHTIENRNALHSHMVCIFIVRVKNACGGKKKLCNRAHAKVNMYCRLNQQRGSFEILLLEILEIV